MRIALLSAVLCVAGLSLTHASPAGDSDFILASLPKEDAIKLAGGDKDLACLAEALRSVPLSTYDKADVRVFENVPFASAAEPVAVVLGSTKEAAQVGVHKAVKHVQLLIAVLDPGSDPLAQLTILRDDGVPTRTKFTAGDNCGPSVGPWDGKVEARQKGFTAKAVAPITAKDGTPVRLFLVDWRNDNEWYPVTDLKFKVLDPKAKARFAVLGITGVGGVKQ
jgi:hypothetical protein